MLKRIGWSFLSTIVWMVVAIIMTRNLKYVVDCSPIFFFGAFTGYGAGEDFGKKD